MNKFAKYLIVMFIAFVCDSVIRYFMPHGFEKTSITMISHIGLMMFTLLNNTIDDDHRYPFALIVGIYYAVVYGNSIVILVLLQCIYAFFGNLYMKKSLFSYLEALMVVSLTIFAQEVVLYWLMWITNVTNLNIITFVSCRLLPTILFNLVLFNGVYFIYNKLKLGGEVNVYFGKRN